MNTRIIRGSAAIAAAALLSACGGGGAQQSVLPANGSASRGTSGVAMRIVIPKRSTSANQRVVQHLPSSTKSLAVSVNGGTAQIVGVQPTDPGCSVASGTGNTVCTVTIVAPIGSDTFDLTAYDGTGAAGNKLSHVNVPETIAAGTNTLAITLSGVVASVALSASGAIYEGAATSSATANVVAKDADGNVIMDAYDKPVTITASGTFTGTTGTVAKSGDTIVLTYDGTDPANVGPTTFAATAGGASIGLTTGTIVSNPLSLAAANVALWYDAADGSQIVANGTTSFTWKDKSGNGKDASSTPGNPLPTYPDTTIKDAKHAFVDFTPGTKASAGPPAVAATPGAFLSRLDGFPGGDYTIFAVAYNTQPDASGTGSNGALIGGGIGTNPNGHGLLLVDDTSYGQYCLYEAGSSCTTVEATTTRPTPAFPSFHNLLYRVTGIDKANTGTLAIDGATTAPAFVQGAMPARVLDPSVVINGYNSDGLTSSTNSIAEIIVLDHAAAPSEQAAIEAYLKAKWSLSL